MSDVTDAMKEIFQSAAALRKKRGIEFVRWSITVDKHICASVDEMWSDWVRLLGTDNAGLLLQAQMITTTRVLMRAKEKQDERKARLARTEKM